MIDATVLRRKSGYYVRWSSGQAITGPYLTRAEATGEIRAAEQLQTVLELMVGVSLLGLVLSAPNDFAAAIRETSVAYVATVRALTGEGE